MSIPVAVQLYTVRDEFEKDIKGTLKKVAEIGYSGVEFAGIPAIDAKELKKELDNLGLKTAGFHIPLDQLKNDINNVIAYCTALDCRYIVCPWAEYKTIEDCDKMAENLSSIGRVCNEEGIELCYHNHNHEFIKYDGEYALDILYSSVKPELLKAEIDVYWVKHAGEEPVSYMKKYRGRIPLLHIKDMDKGEEKEFAEIGNGIIDFKPIIEEAELSGTKWLIVEQDVCRRPPLESIEISFKNLKKIL